MEGLSLERTEIIIAEYTAIRGEITALTQSEDTFISTFITFMAAFVGAAFLLSDKNDQLVRISQIFMIWFCPLVIMFFVCLLTIILSWISKVLFRMSRNVICNHISQRNNR